MGWISIKYSQFRSTSFIIPDTDYPTIIKISSSEFVSLCSYFTSLSDCVKIEVKEEKCTFLVTGKTGSGKYALKNNKTKEFKIKLLLLIRKSFLWINRYCSLY